MAATRFEGRKPVTQSATAKLARADGKQGCQPAICRAAPSCAGREGHYDHEHADSISEEIEGQAIGDALSATTKLNMNRISCLASSCRPLDPATLRFGGPEPATGLGGFTELKPEDISVRLVLGGSN